MLIKYHDLESYYLNRRLELLGIMDQFAQEAFHDDEFEMPDNHPKIKMLQEQYSDVMDPESLCETLKKIYPEHLFDLHSRNK